MYRAPDGTQCAVGCLISDEHYDESLEFKNMGTPTAKPGTPEAFPILFYPVLEAVQKSIGRELEQDEVGMLGRLQTIHDCHGPDSWRQSLKSLARDLGLTTPWGQP